MVSWMPATREGGLQTSASTAAPDLMILVLVTVAAACIICMVAPMRVALQAISCMISGHANVNLNFGQYYFQLERRFVAYSVSSLVTKEDWASAE